MVNKKVVIISTIIAILIVGVIVGIKIKKLDNVQEIISEEKPKNTVVQNNVIENTVINNNVISNETKNEVENTITNTNTTKTENSVKNTSVSNSEVKTDEKLTGEEKAKQLAKDKWGKTDDNVYYYVEDKLSENEYIVSVRDSDTTVSLMDYKVNIKTEEITEY